MPVDQGQYDFGLLDLAVMAGCAGRGLDLTAIAGVWPRSPIGIFSLKELNITKPKDLEGQSIGFVTGGGEFQLWPAFVKATGIDASKVKIISMDPAGLMRRCGRQTDPGGRQFLRQYRPDVLGQQDRHQRNVLRGLRRQDVQRRPCLQAFHTRERGGGGRRRRRTQEGPEIRLPEPGKGDRPAHREPPGIATREVLSFGQEVGTSLGLVPSCKNHGLGYMDPDLIAATRNSAIAYMDIKTVPPADRLFSNRFVGGVGLSGAEWSQVEARVRSTLPSVRG